MTAAILPRAKDIWPQELPYSFQRSGCGREPIILSAHKVCSMSFLTQLNIMP